MMLEQQFFLMLEAEIIAVNRYGQLLALEPNSFTLVCLLCSQFATSRRRPNLASSQGGGGGGTVRAQVGWAATLVRRSRKEVHGTAASWVCFFADSGPT